MIALPVAALAFAAVTYDMFELRPGEKADRVMGTGQALVIWPYDGPALQDPTQLAYIPGGGLGEASSATAEPPALDRLLALLPAGTRAVSDQIGHLNVHTATGTGSVSAELVDYADPLARGLYRPVSGRAPANPDEIALTPAASHRIGAGVGGTVRLADGSRTFHVVGIAENPDKLQAETIIARPGALPASVLSADRGNLRWIVATPAPLTWVAVKQLNTHGVVAVSRQVLAHPPGAAERYPEFKTGDSDAGAFAAILVGGLAMLEIVLLAGPAFAVGARRRRRDLALVAASGGTPAHLRRIVLADGVVLGAVAAVAGVASGIAIAVAGRPLIEAHLSHSRAGGFRVYPLALAVLAGLAVTTGVLAAVVPAWISSRQDVVAALSGRRGITRSRRRWVVVGVLVMAAGAATSAVGAWRISAVIILAGLIGAELGLVLCTPAVVGLVTRIGRWLPLAPRIALRDTSRNRTAAAPAIAAVLAAVVGTIAVGVVISADDERATHDYRTSGRPGDVGLHSGSKTGPGSGRSMAPETLATVRAILPVRQIADIDFPMCGDEGCLVEPRMPADRDCPYSSQRLQRDPTPAEQRAARRDHRCDGLGQIATYFGGGFRSPSGMTVVVDAAAAGVVTNLPARDADQAAAALRAGQVVVGDPGYLDNGRVTLTIETAAPRGSRGEQRTVTAPGFALPDRPAAPITMMTPATARSLGLGSQWWATVVTTTRMPTVAEQDRLQAALGTEYGVKVEEAPQRSTPALIVLIIVAGVITLGAAAIATGLTAADGRADLATLAAVGASPRVRRALSLSQSGVIAGLGSLIGVVAGLGASLAVLAALNQRYADLWPAPTPYPLTVPWLSVAVALVVVPLIAMLGAGLLTRSRLPIERRL